MNKQTKKELLVLLSQVKGLESASEQDIYALILSVHNHQERDQLPS